MRSKSFFETISKDQDVFLLVPDFDSEEFDFDNSLPMFIRAKVIKVETHPAYPLYKKIVISYDDREKEWEIIDNKQVAPYIIIDNISIHNNPKAICQTPEACRECYNFLIDHEIKQLGWMKDEAEQRIKNLEHNIEYYKQMKTCPIMDSSKGENEGRSV